jgi:hypothetical protein
MSTASDIMNNAYRWVMDLEEGYKTKLSSDDKIKLVQSYALVASNDYRTSSMCAISDNVCEALLSIAESLAANKGDV